MSHHPELCNGVDDELMLKLGVNETIDQLAVADSVRW